MSHRQGEVRRDLARSYVETPSMRGSVMRENRETLRSPVAVAPRDAMGSLRTRSIGARRRESDCLMVPTKFPNKERRSWSLNLWLS
jgi:hypothetical protein